MHVLFSDGQLMQWGGHLHLANFAGNPCVVGPGFLCAVTSVAEGNRVMAKLKAEAGQRGVVIEFEPGGEADGPDAEAGSRLRADNLQG